MDFNIIEVNKENIDKEHICCAISGGKDKESELSKKKWMKNEFESGLTFKKLNVRGKVFIEYVPADMAWCPIEASGYMYINCFWVSGKYKGKGYANQLLDLAIKDSKEKKMKGMVVLSSNKKKPFLSDPKYLKYKGFKLCDTAYPYYELLYLPFDESEDIPKFKNICKNGEIECREAIIYYSNQCPHTEKYSNIAKEIAESNGVSLKLIKFTSSKEAQNAPSPFTTYSLFYNGKFVTNEILSEKKILKFIEKI